METLHIDGTKDVPEVLLDASKGVFKISGRSCPENFSEFYGQVLRWLDGYIQTPNDKTVFDFKLIYYNTASAKMILTIMQKIESMKEAGLNVTIRWHYPDDDDDMQESGEDYADLIEVPFEQISYSLDDE